jgi:alpha-glucosidase
MQWDSSPNAGFTAGEPWLPLADDYPTVNVAAQLDDPASMLSFYRRLIALRRAEPALEIGAYRGVPADGHLCAYTRALGPRRFLIALNLGPFPATLNLPDPALHGRVLIGTHLDREGDAITGRVELRGDEGIVAALSP